MFKKLLLFGFVMVFPLASFAIEDIKAEDIQKESAVQKRLNDVGVSILNSNKIDGRVVFVYDKTEVKEKLKLDKTSVDRQIIVYGYDYKFIEDDNELAAFLSRRIAEAYRSYPGLFKGRLNSLKIKAAPKKYQIIFDKIGVDYMVRSGYNPVAMITLVNKSYPQKRGDSLTNNATSKRLAKIYEHICVKYPYYLVNNEYYNNKNYQNFLLTSQDNRKMLEEKLKNRSRKELNYE